jgi:serine/threonine protein kinase
MVKYFDEELFRFGNEIGRGGDGYVLDAENLASKKRCAIKVVQLDNCGKYFFNSERQIMHKLNKYNHKNILHADYFVKKDENSSSSSQGFIVMDKMDCDLCDYMGRNARLSEDEAKIIIKQVCEAVKFMHSKKIAHLDLKLDNILINMNNKAIKLCDFVRAFDWDGKKRRMVDEMIGRRISREYRAPEVANKDEYRVDKLE